MSERACFDRILRDDDDMSGQTVRQWRIEAEAGRIVIKDSAGDDSRYFLGMRATDVEAFIADLRRARTFAFEAKSASGTLNTNGESKNG